MDIGIDSGMTFNVIVLNGRVEFAEDYHAGTYLKNCSSRSNFKTGFGWVALAGVFTKPRPLCQFNSRQDRGFPAVQPRPPGIGF